MALCSLGNTPVRNLGCANPKLIWTVDFEWTQATFYSENSYLATNSAVEFKIRFQNHIEKITFLSVWICLSTILSPPTFFLDNGTDIKGWIQFFCWLRSRAELFSPHFLSCLRFCAKWIATKLCKSYRAARDLNQGQRGRQEGKHRPPHLLPPT